MSVRWSVTAILGLFLATSVGSKQIQADPTQIPAEADSRSTLLNCFVMIIDEAEVPTQEAGVLSELKVREGSEVRAGDLLARVDDRRAEIDKRLAESDYAAAKEKADNDINVRYAKSAADVAEAEVSASLDANKRVPNSVSVAEIRKLQLEYRRAVLQIEQSNLEQSVAKHTAQGEAAKVEAAADNVRRRQITSPLDGTVVEVRHHLGEWVQPGDAVLRVVRFDRLRVEGFVKASPILAARIHRGDPVTVELQVGDQRREFAGTVTYVNPLQQTGGNYRVWAEIRNVAEGGQWLLQPGQPVTMKVR